MKLNFFLKTVIAIFIIVLVVSCDKDINEIGSGIVGNEHFGMDVDYKDVVAYSQNLGPVQTNNLTINQLGYYNNPVFGKTKASFVTELSLASENPTFIDTPANIVVDSVYLYVPYFSTFVSKPGIYLEDLFILESHRGKGYGKKLLLQVIALAKQRNCGRVDWSVLNWNKPAIDFYESLGATAMNEWTTYRLNEETISTLLNK